MGDEHRRIVILSDTHLDRPGAAQSADTLRPLWTDADELIINGDLAERHDASYRAAPSQLVLRLQDLCVLSGNHDHTDREGVKP